MANNGVPAALTLSANVNAPDTGAFVGRRQHVKYWLADGSVVLQTQDLVYKVHHSLLARHSPFLAEFALDTVNIPLVHLPNVVDNSDVEALLAHLYHDNPLSEETPFPHAAAILRASSPAQLHLPAIHSRARRQLERLFPTTPTPYFQPDNADAALMLAVEYNIYPIQKALYYTLAAHSELAHDEPDDPSRISTLDLDTNIVRPNLQPAVEARCKALLNHFIDHFTPILFTVGTAQHMACTDILAEFWMPLVLQPALESSGLCHPLETLQTLIDLDWRAYGLCEDCIREKQTEWRNEQYTMWERMDGWLELSPEL